MRIFVTGATGFVGSAVVAELIAAGHEVLGLAREKGVSAYVGNGKSRWAAVHRLDAAHLFRLAIEKGSVGDEGVPLKVIAVAIRRHLNVPVVSKAPEDAAEHFGWFAPFASIDTLASSERTRAQLGWEPKQPGLIADLDRSNYF